MRGKLMITGAVVFVVLLAGMASAVQAGTLDVAPVTLTLDKGGVGVFYVTNRSSKPIMAQVEGLLWSQPDDEKDRLEPTSDVVISPPLVRLMPGRQQTVRFMVRPKEATGVAEHTYRLVVSELPDAYAEPGGDVRMLLRVSVPVFVVTGAVSADRLQWSAQNNGVETMLTARNAGASHAKIADVTLADGNGKQVTAEDKGFRYILAGASVRWKMPPVPYGTAWRVKASDEVRGLMIDTPLRLSP